MGMMGFNLPWKLKQFPTSTFLGLKEFKDTLIHDRILDLTEFITFSKNDIYRIQRKHQQKVTVEWIGSLHL